ncbi:MAG: helix-turn-helix transcriptional regulator [Dehalococcoidia bacterium]
MTTRQQWAGLRRSRGVRPENTVEYKNAACAFDLGEAVRTLRIARGMTQAELAQAIGAHQPSVSRIEGGGNPTLETIGRLADALGAEVVVLFRRRSDSPLDSAALSAPDGGTTERYVRSHGTKERVTSSRDRGHVRRSPGMSGGCGVLSGMQKAHSM